MAKSNKGLIAAIIFATVAITGSLVFLGLQIGNNSSLDDSTLAAKINEGIQEFVKKQQEAQQPILEIDNELVDPVNNDDPILGEKNASITLIEYSDFLCPYCYQFHDTAQQLVENSNGEINWIYRHFPLSSHDPEATMAAIASECVYEEVGNDAFWAYTRVLFENRDRLTRENLIAYGTELGANETKLAECIDEEKYMDRVQTDIQMGIQAGVSGTPGNFLINNKTQKTIRVSGAQPVEALQQVIDSLKE